MNTSVVTTADELYEFLMAAEERLGDPAQAVCLLVAPWSNVPLGFADECGLGVRYANEKQELVFEMVDEDGVRSLPLRVSAEDCVIEGGVLKAFHVRSISRGVWALAPSLNVPGALHAFVVLTGVPDPAPWERLIVLATGF